jgi:hypothetical protein
MGQPGTISCKSQLHKNVSAANEVAIMAGPWAELAVGRHAENKFLQRKGTVLCKPTAGGPSDRPHFCI